MKFLRDAITAAVLTVSLVTPQSAFTQDIEIWYSGSRTGFWGVAESIGFRGNLPMGFGLTAGPESLSASRQVGGYRISDLLAIERAQTRFGSKHFECGGEPAAGNGQSYCLGTAWSVSGVAILPLELGFSLYGRFGMQLWQPSPMEDQTGAASGSTDMGQFYGVGLRYGLTRSITVQVEAEYFSDVNSIAEIGLGLNSRLFDTGIHSIGLSVRF